jgi:cell division protein FtsZ
LLREHTPTPELEQKPKLETELKPEPEYVPEREPLPKTMEELEKDELLGEPVSEEGVSEEATPRAAYVQNAIKKVIGDKDILFIFTCLDDEHDIENALILSEITSKENILTIVIASLPRYFGNVENVYATNKILQRLRLIAEIVILIPYFETLDFKIIPKLVIELLEVISKPGLINLDVADLKIIVKGGNVGVITFGSGKHHTRHKDALFEAIDSRLVNVEFASVSKALINVKGGKDMTLGEVEGLAEQIRKRIKPGATLILGATIDQDLFDQISLFILIGITPMQIMVNMYANE